MDKKLNILLVLIVISVLLSLLQVFPKLNPLRSQAWGGGGGGSEGTNCETIFASVNRVVDMVHDGIISEADGRKVIDALRPVAATCGAEIDIENRDK